MEIVNSIYDFDRVDNGVLTIGNFDGFHRGHIQIIERLLLLAKEKKTKSYLLTFKNHPFSVLKTYPVPKRITPLDFNISFLREKGLDVLILIEFTQEIADFTKEEFLNLLKTKFDKLTLVVGEDFKFGKSNEGDVQFLINKVDKDFSVDIVLFEKYLGEKIASSKIRKLIEQGSIETANELLGREYFIEGEVIKGKGIGKKICFPTINIISDTQVYPKDGVYYTNTQLDNYIYDSMTYVGKSNVFTNNAICDYNRVIETNIFNFDRDIYGKKVRVFFKEFLRDNIEISNINELISLLEKDKKTIQDKVAIAKNKLNIIP